MDRSSNQKTCKNKGGESHPDIVDKVKEVLEDDTKVIAWDKVNKEMIEDVASIHFKAEMIVTSNLCFYPFKDIELLQSTGLLDKNGKEIFEGDIVKFKNPYDKRFKALGVVVLREDKACFGIDMEGTTEQFELYRITAENYLTVIGNIYQDEHLQGED